MNRIAALFSLVFLAMGIQHHHGGINTQQHPEDTRLATMAPMNAIISADDASLVCRLKLRMLQGTLSDDAKNIIGRRIFEHFDDLYGMITPHMQDSDDQVLIDIVPNAACAFTGYVHIEYEFFVGEQSLLTVKRTGYDTGDFIRGVAGDPGIAVPWSRDMGDLNCIVSVMIRSDDDRWECIFSREYRNLRLEDQRPLAHSELSDHETEQLFAALSMHLRPSSPLHSGLLSIVLDRGLLPDIAVGLKISVVHRTKTNETVLDTINWWPGLAQYQIGLQLYSNTFQCDIPAGIDSKQIVIRVDGSDTIAARDGRKKRLAMLLGRDTQNQVWVGTRTARLRDIGSYWIADWE